MTEITKYLIRFSVILVIAFPLVAFTQGVNTLRILGYKISLVAIAVGLAEAIWIAFFKIVYGKTEEMTISERKDILIFRGILYAAVILAFTLGL